MKFKILFLLLLNSLGYMVYAQNDKIAKIEGDTSSDKSPIMASENYSYSQFIYLNSEIVKTPEDIVIKRMTFKMLKGDKKFSSYFTNSKKWIVNLGETDVTEYVSQGTGWGAGAKRIEKMTKVFDGEVDYNRTNGEITIELSKSFTLKKGKNLVVEVFEDASEKESEKVSTLFSHKSSNNTRTIFYEYPHESMVGMLEENITAFSSEKMLKSYPAVNIVYSSLSKDETTTTDNSTDNTTNTTVTEKPTIDTNTDNTTNPTTKPQSVTEYTYYVGEKIKLDVEVTGLENTEEYNYEWRLDDELITKDHLLLLDAKQIYNNKLLKVKVAKKTSGNCYATEVIKIKIEEEELKFEGITAENESICDGDTPIFIVKGSKGAVVEYYIDKDKTQKDTVTITPDGTGKIKLAPITNGSKTITVTQLVKDGKTISIEQQAKVTVVKPKVIIKVIE